MVKQEESSRRTRTSSFQPLQIITNQQILKSITHQLVRFDKLGQLSHSGLKSSTGLQTKFARSHFYGRLHITQHWKHKTKLINLEPTYVFRSLYVSLMFFDSNRMILLWQWILGVQSIPHRSQCTCSWLRVGQIISFDYFLLFNLFNFLCK